MASPGRPERREIRRRKRPAMNEGIPEPVDLESPIACHTSCSVALAAGNRMVRSSGEPSAFLPGAPSALTMRTCAPSQLACREPEAKSQRAVTR